jgi:sugar phosphate permease
MTNSVAVPGHHDLYTTKHPSSEENSEKFAVSTDEYVQEHGASTPSTIFKNPSLISEQQVSQKHHDPNWAGDGIDTSSVDAQKTLRKMDIRLIPMLAVLYLLSFLDRGNIGNAKIQGLQTDLKLTGQQYNLCATVFFFTYCAFEIPSNLLLKRFRPSIWLPSIMVAWGTVMTLMGLVKNYHGLLIARLFLGVAEAGLYPGVAYYLTMWYCTEELAFRQGLFFSAASIAGAFSGLLAYLIAKMNGVGGLAGWQWIFILEGLLTVVVAIASFFILHDFPDTAGFLTTEEKAWVVHRLKYQGSKKSGRNIAETEHFEWKYVVKGMSLSDSMGPSTNGGYSFDRLAALP